MMAATTTTTHSRFSDAPFNHLAFQYRTEMLLKIYSECPSTNSQGTKTKNLVIENAYDHILHPVTGCKWCQKRYREL